MAETTKTGAKTLTDDDIATTRYQRGPAGSGNDADAHTDVDTDAGHSAPVATDADAAPQPHRDSD